MKDVLKVKRDGPRGWHWIDKAKFDPAVHELFDAPEAEPKKVTAADLRSALTEKGIEFKANASKPELQALLDAA